MAKARAQVLNLGPVPLQAVAPREGKVGQFEEDIPQRLKPKFIMRAIRHG
jgi:hypothetical protein